MEQAVHPLTCAHTEALAAKNGAFEDGADVSLVCGINSVFSNLAS